MCRGDACGLCPPGRAPRRARKVRRPHLGAEGFQLVFCPPPPEVLHCCRFALGVRPRSGLTNCSLFTADPATFPTAAPLNFFCPLQVSGLRTEAPVLGEFVHDVTLLEGGGRGCRRAEGRTQKAGGGRMAGSRGLVANGTDTGFLQRGSRPESTGRASPRPQPLHQGHRGGRGCKEWNSGEAQRAGLCPGRFVPGGGAGFHQPRPRPTLARGLRGRGGSEDRVVLTHTIVHSWPRWRRPLVPPRPGEQWEETALCPRPRAGPQHPPRVAGGNGLSHVCGKSCGRLGARGGVLGCRSG